MGKLLLGTAARADKRDAPAEMDEVKPKFFSESGVGAKPVLQIMVGSLPVLPAGRDGAHSATLGAKVINIERFQNEFNFTFGFF